MASLPVALAAFAFTFFTSSAPAGAAAGINSQMSFQGKIVKSDGTNITDGTYNMEFKIYQDGNNQGVGSTLKWTEDWLVGGSGGISLTSGTFQVNLGAHNPFGSQVDWNQDTLWLSLQIGNSSSCTISTDFHTDCGGDTEMKPYIRLTAVPYAQNAASLSGLSAGNFVQLAQGLQTDNTTANGSIAINKTGASGDILLLEANSKKALEVNNSGTVLLGQAGASGLNGTLTFNNGTGSNTVSLSLQADPGSSYTLLLPTTGPSTSQCLQTDASTANQLVFAACVTGGGGATSVAYSTTANSSGGSITGSVLTLAKADGSNPGLLSADAQTIGGDKTLVGNTLVKKDSATAFQVQNSGSGSLLNVDTQYSNITLLGNNDGQTGPWTNQASNLLPSIRAFATSITANGYAYVIGGDTTSSSPQNTILYAKLNADGSTGPWTNQASNLLPAARDSATSVTANGFVYVLGGNNGTPKNSVFYAKLNADGSTGPWINQASNLLPAAREEATSVTLNGYIYVLGGWNGGGQNTIFYAKLNADGSTGPWTNQASNLMPDVRLDATSVTANGYAYVFGGDTTGSNPQNTIFYAKLNADGSTGPWTNQASNLMPAARYFATSVAANGYAYVLGGEEPSFRNTVFYAKLNADGSTGPWTNQASNPLPDFSHNATSVMANGYMYVFGGGTDTIGYKNTVFYTSLSRLKVGGSLDLIGATSSGNLSDPGAGGSLNAGDITAVGNFQVQGQGSFARSVGITGTLSVAGSAVFQNSSNSASAFQVQTASGANLLTVDSTGNQIILGTANTGGISGALVFNNSSGNNTATLTLSGNPGSSYVYQLPTSAVNSNQCLQSGTVSGVTVPLSFASCGATSVAYSTTANSSGGSITGSVLTLAKADGSNPGLLSADAQTIGGDKTFQGLVILQPASSLTAGQTALQQSFTNGSSTGGTVNGFSQTLTVGNTTATSTTNGLNVALTDATTLANNNNGVNATITDNGASGAKTNKAVVGSAGGTNSSATNYGGYFSLSGGSSSSAALFATNGLTNGNILQLQDGTTTSNVFTIADGGAVSVQNQTNSANAFKISNNAGSTVFNIDNTKTNINNKVTNPSFESAVSGWSSINAGAVSQSSAQAYEGSNSLLIATGTSASGGGASYTTGASFLTSGQTYILSAYVKTDSGLNVSTFEMGHADNGTAPTLVPCLSGKTLPKSGGWQLFTCSWVSGSITGSPFIYFKQTDAVNRNLYIDSVILQTTSNSDGVYRNSAISFTGSIINGSVVLQNASDSSNALQVENSAGSSVFNIDTTNSSNLISNPSFEKNTIGWAALSSTIAQDQTQAYSGKYSLKISATSAGSGVQYNPGLAIAKINTNYTVSFYASLISGAAPALQVLYSPDGSSSVVCSIPNTLVTSGWTRVSCTFTTSTFTPQSGNFLIIRQTNAVVGTWAIDGVQMEEASSASNYGSGALTIDGAITSPVIIQGPNSTTAFQIQNSSGISLFNVDTTNTTISFGSTTNGLVLTASTYEPVLNGTARHTLRISLTPEYPGATMTGTGTGTMTSDNETASPFHNYYKWTTTQGTSQSYSVWVRVPLPMDFSAWCSSANCNPTIFLYTKNSGSSASSVQIATYDTANASVQALTNIASANTSWNENSVNATASAQTWTAGGYMTLQIQMSAISSSTTQIGELRMDYLSKY